MKTFSAWKTALIDIDRSAEFTGDDVDQYSKLVDLGQDFEEIVLDVPTLTSSALNIYVQKDGEVATVPVAVHYRQPTDLATAAWGTTASTGAFSISAKIGGYQYLRVRAASNQAADRSIKVRGVK